VPQPSASEEVSIGKFKRCKLPGADQIPADLIQGGGGVELHSEIHKFNKLIQKSGINQLLHLFTRRKIKLTVVIIEAYHCCQLYIKMYPAFSSLEKFHMQMELLGINMDFNIIGQ
jgi:hypothetical protein